MVRKIFYLTLLMLLFLPAFARAIEAQLGAKAQPGTFQVNVSKDYLSLDAHETPLVRIFEEIGKQARITFDSNIGPEEKITLRLDRVPLEEGIKQLAKNVTVFYAQGPTDKTTRIARVVVLSEAKGGSSSRAPGSSEPAKVNEPPPEPFKFDFDPGNSFKGKVRKQP
jgi:hypothetical protein